MGYMLHSTTLVMIFTKLQVLLLARLGNMELECELIWSILYYLNISLCPDSCNRLPAAWDGGGINITHLFWSGSHLESKTGEKEAGRLIFLPEKKGQIRAGCLNLQNMLKNVKIVWKLTKWRTKQLTQWLRRHRCWWRQSSWRKSARRPSTWSRWTGTASLSQKGGKFRLMVHLLRNSVRIDDFVYIIESKEDCLCFP